MKRMRCWSRETIPNFESAACLAMLTLGLLSCAGPQLSAEDGKTSVGIYRIPYEDNARVRIINDHKTHKPPNRIDMVGSKPQRIVAAASGIVRYVVEEFSEQQKIGSPQCNNNYVWLEHPNGEWTKYSHMLKGSTRGAAKLKVGDKVQAGTYLGDEGAVGCASGRHLHFEVAIPTDRTNPITRVGGFIRGQNRIPIFCDVPERALFYNRTYTAAKCS